MEKLLQDDDAQVKMHAVTVPEKPNLEGQQILVELVSEDYFKTLGLGQLGGRLLSETEIDSARHVAVINEALSDRLFAHENPIGQSCETLPSPRCLFPIP
jgi:hypothetical protein